MVVHQDNEGNLLQKLEDFCHSQNIAHADQDTVCLCELICYIEQARPLKFVHSLTVMSNVVRH